MRCLPEVTALLRRGRDYRSNHAHWSVRLAAGAHSSNMQRALRHVGAKLAVHCGRFSMQARFVAVALAIAFAGCTSAPPAMQAKAPLKDGEPAVPGDYKSWPKMLTSVQRPD